MRDDAARGCTIALALMLLFGLPIVALVWTLTR